MKTALKYLLLSLPLALAAVPSAQAINWPTPTPRTAPEVDLAIGGLVLLVGSLSVVYARRSKR
jgi:hypothetical protein